MQVAFIEQMPLAGKVMIKHTHTDAGLLTDIGDFDFVVRTPLE
ncbi:hypothetical protein SDC9_181512 [bioreactor metagenome]|uniref:Uncharacterized protein n=1 Tax=bioreactor metagenome TaxID=1076179 RepID=A0A645H5P3_9ZZZZ